MANLVAVSTHLPRKMWEYVHWLAKIRRMSKSHAVRDLTGAGMAYVDLVTVEVRRIMSVHRPAVISKNAIVMMLRSQIPGVEENIDLVLGIMTAADELVPTSDGWVKTDRMPATLHRVTR